MIRRPTLGRIRSPSLRSDSAKHGTPSCSKLLDGRSTTLNTAKRERRGRGILPPSAAAHGERRQEYKVATEAAFLAWLEENVPPEQFALWEEDYTKARKRSRERAEGVPKHAGTTVRMEDGRIVEIRVVYHGACRRPKPSDDDF